jgi:hypothetical protein
LALGCFKRKKIRFGESISETMANNAKSVKVIFSANFAIESETMTMDWKKDSWFSSQ